MAAKYREIGVDHNGNQLVDGISGTLRVNNGVYSERLSRSMEAARHRWRQATAEQIVFGEEAWLA